MLVALAISAGLVASSNASAAMVKTVVETVSNIQNTFTIMAAAPAQPAAPTAVAGNKSATLSWTAPTNNGAAITSYTVTSIPGEFTCTVSSLSCVITGLSNETSYTFTVTATNSLGTSVQSNQSAAITPTHTPRQLSSATAATNYSTFVAYTPDGRYGLIATDSAPPSIVKFDFATGTVTETIDLASNTPVVNEVAYDENYAYFFYSGGFAKLDMAGMFVVTTPSFGTASSKVAVDNTGAYLLRTLNPNVNDAKSYLKKYDSTTGAEVASVTVGTSSSTEIADVFVVDDTAYLLVQTSSKLTLRKVQISTMALNASAIDIDPGKNGTNFFIRDVKVLADSNTAVVTYRSDDQFSSLSGNKIHIAKLGLNPMSLQGLVTTDNGADTAISYNAVAYDELGYGYWFTNSTLSANGNMNKVSIDNLSVVIKSAFATKPTTEANREFIRVAQVYDGKLTVIGESSTVGWMRTFAVGDVANEPTNLTAQYGDQQATLTWRSPTDLGVGTDVSYTVESTVGGFNCTTIELRCVVTGLTNGTSYIFKVTATNTDGVGLASATTSVTPKRAPDAPTAATATYGAASATVSWSAPANNGGATISSYTVTSNPGGKTCTTATRTCAVTGLTNGSSYTFSVTATNVAGTSPASPETTAVIPRTVPSAPNSVTTAFGNTEVSLTWSAPTIDGGASISGYRVVSNPGSKTCTTDALTTACTITGLTNGTAYTFAVTAQNSEGSSSAATSASVTPATKPDAPAAPKVISTSNGAVGLSVSAPVNNGGAAISSYRVTSNPGGKFCTASTLTNNACTVSGLTNGTTYTFTATAKNIAGTSEDSPASTNAIPRTSPSAPTGLTATFGNASVSLSWSAPVDNGGFAISSYKVTTVGNATKTCTVNAPTTTCVITGLTNGTTYSFSVIATNGASLMSAASISASATPKTTPSAPQNVSLTAQDGALRVTWSAGNNGGSTITGYTATATPGDLTCTTATTSCTISGLTNGATYNIKVVATNVVGAGAASAAANAVPDVAPAAPTSVQATASPTKLAISWGAPADNGGTSVLGYRATATPGGAFCETTAPTTTCEITGLTNGTSYTVKVAARNALGSGLESAASNSATPKDVPYSPSAPTANAGDGKVTLTWTAPGDGGSPILSYTVVDVDETSITCTVLAPNTWCEIPELTNGMEYSFKVRAKNSIGDSQFSAASAVAVPLGLPDAPSIFEVQSLDKSVKVSYTEPLLDGGSPVVTYVVTAQPGGKTCATNLLECTVTGLTNGTDYTFTVQARNKIGLGGASEASDPVAPWGAPSAPTGIKTEAGESEVTVLWTAPSNTNFDTTSYAVTSNPGGFTCEVTGDVSCTVTDLDNGESYTFTVVATNSAGSSPASAASAATRPRTTPDAPLNAITRVISTGIEVSWIAPEFDGGSKVTFYTAFAYDFEDQPLDLTCTTSANSCVVGGLTQGDDYYFTVTASNVAGESAESEPTELVTFGAVPSKPNSVFAIAGPGEVTVSWAAPLNTGGSDISYYVAESTPGGFVCVVEGQSCVITGLTNGTSYTFTVRAANEFGESDNSIATAAVAPVAKPGQPSVVESMFISYSELLVRWTAPSASVNAYRVSLLEPNYPYTEIDAVTVPAAQLTYTFEGLLASNAYRVQVVAYGSGASYVRAAAAPARAVGPVLFTELPAVTGSVMVGKVLTAGDGLFIGTPAPTLTRSWYRCNQPQIEFSPLSADCVVIKGATSASYKLTITDLNKYVIFGLKAANAYGDTWAFGLTEAKVVSAPILSKTATLSGTSKSGRVLSAKAGTWLGSSKITYKYQWMRCTTTYKAATSKGAKCAAISKATAATYKLATADVGKYIRVVVTAANPYGKAESHSVTTGKVSK